MIRPVQLLLAAALCLALLAFPLEALSDTQLPALPAPSQSFDAGTIHVDRYGNGAKALVFIPGLSCGPWSWAEQIKRFSKDYSVYALTLNGFDGRPYVPQQDPFGSFQRDFWKLLNERNIVKPVVIGHSLGATLALALAATHPERLGGVVALDGLPVFPAVAMSSPAKRMAAANALRAQVSAQTPAQFTAYERAFMANIGTIHKSLVVPTAALEAKSAVAAVADWIYADVATDLRPQLPHANVRILELMPYSTSNPYSEGQTLAFYRMLLIDAPDATVEPIEDARHFAMLDEPAAVDAAITRFLATASR